MNKISRFFAPLILTGALVSNVAFAQESCDPEREQKANEKAQKILAEEVKKIENVYGGHMKQPDWLAKSDGLLTACYKANWPQYKPSLPLLATLYKMAQEKLVKAACDKARSLIADGASSYQSIIKTIPGYEQIQDIQSGNLGNWGQVGDLLGDLPSSGTVDWGSLGQSIPGINQLPTVPGVTNPVAQPAQPPVSTPSNPTLPGIQ